VIQLLRALALAILSRSTRKPADPFASFVVRFPSPAAHTGQVLVDGHDISHACRALAIGARVGDLVEIKLELLGHLLVEADAPVVARLISLDDLQREASADAPHAAGSPA